MKKQRMTRPREWKGWVATTQAGPSLQSCRTTRKETADFVRERFMGVIPGHVTIVRATLTLTPQRPKPARK